MHVRRGDACERWASAGDGSTVTGRPCFPLAAYVYAARELKARYGARRILLATDSTEVTHQLRRQLLCTGCEEFEWVFLDFDRTAVGGGDDVAAAGPPASAGAAGERWHNFIEFRKGVDYELAFTSYRAERMLLRDADFFVGTSVAVVSRLILLGLTGRAGHVPPFILLDQPFGGAFAVKA